MTTRSFLKLVLLAPLGLLLPPMANARHPQLQIRRLTIYRNGEVLADQPFSNARAGDTIWIHNPDPEDVDTRKGFIVEEDPVPTLDPYNQGDWSIIVRSL
jgi:hypothetical protein